ncbi:NADP-dependent oxidoreductase domain-containing protein [Podospora appendiculata]|uniref:NADP-dependent oxidoreductase domain-containing protein n=1 Tax=Podospora appendiculata TaxID=314037 RepID=A0AAE0XAY8_9PEZI|nr:NADP-dependent oxidoreductase domain-containing protein [Podospora appendiculata]
MPPHLVFGAGGIGTTANSFTFTWDTPEKVSELLNVLKKLDILELDSAAIYPPGNPWNTETLLGQSRAAEKGFIIDSKVFVKWEADKPQPSLDENGISSSAARTLELIGADKLRTLYAHMPDKNTPLEETVLAFHKQFVAGKFDRLGLSNYDAAELAKYLAICEANNYVKPSVYQGCYNAVTRKPEEELVPLLRRHNIAYYVFSPLAGGFLTGKVTQAIDSGDESALARTRWRGESAFPLYVSDFDTPAMHDAIRKLRAVCEAASPPVTLQEASMRWLMHHSVLRDGDGIVFGAKTVQQIESNVQEARRGPLSPELAEAVDGLYEIASRGAGGAKM